MIRLRFADLRGAHPDWLIRTFAHAISWWTRSPWNHVDALSDRGGDALLGALPGDGVAWRRTVPARSIKVVSVPCTPEQETAFWAFVAENNGKPYDYLGLIGFALGIDDDRAWFCSELIAAALEHAGIMTFNTRRVSPAQLLALVNAARSLSTTEQ
jgi:hypothetical protein